MIATLPLSVLLGLCAPRVAPSTMAAIVAVESHGFPFAIADDSAHQAYFPATEAEAVRITRRLERLGHNYDAGLAQVNSANFAAYGLTSQSVFDPCANLAAGSSILVHAYRRAAAWIGARQAQDAQTVLVHAFSIYNSGSPTAAISYADRVRRAARSQPAAQLARIGAIGFSTATAGAESSAGTVRIVPVDLAALQVTAGL
jgi:type IV secretion system protein VirB1